SAVIMSRSRLRPGRRTTADFMASSKIAPATKPLSVQSKVGRPAWRRDRLCWKNVRRTSRYGNAVVLDDGIGEQPVAHRLELGRGPGFVRSGEFQVEHLALANRADPLEAQSLQGLLDRLSLRVQNAVLE